MKILFININPEIIANALKPFREIDGISIEFVESCDSTELLTYIYSENYQAIITGHNYENIGLEIADLIQPLNKPVIIIALEENPPQQDQQNSIEACKNGAYAYLCHQALNSNQLYFTVHQALNRNNLQSTLAQGFNDITESLLIAINADQKVINVNSKTCKLTGYTESELIGKNWFDLCLPPAQAETTKRYFNVCIANKAISDTLENQIIDREGQTHTIEWHCQAVFDQHGNTIAILCSGIDITEKTRFKSELKQSRYETRDLQLEMEHINRQLSVSIEQANMMAQQALEASQSKSSFLANVSHEIRTPMNGILGFSEILINELDDEDQRGYANTIYSCASNLLQLLNDLLDFSKIEAGRMDLEIVEQPLEELVHEVHTLMSTKASEKNIEFKVNLLTGIPSFIRTDPTRLRQCLVNLIGNAIKFTCEGYVHINVSSRNNGSYSMLRIDIEDTGIGIPDDAKKHIFDSFTQADASTTRKFGGTGLGLAITKQLIELLQGQIELKSTPGKGSTFSLLLPVYENTPTVTDLTADTIDQMLIDNEQQNIVIKEADTFTALIVDDNQHNRQLLSIHLKRLGLKFITAIDGLQAVNMTDKHKPDIILMDIEMPRMNGLEATREIRKKHILPIIALTGNDDPLEHEKYYQAGCDNVITKPIEPKTLEKSLERYVNIKKIKEKTEKNKLQINNEKIISSLSFDPELVAVVESFLEELPQIMEQMNQALQNNDTQELQALTHLIKGSGGNSGFDILYRKATQLEDSIQSQQTQDIQQLVNELNELMPRLSARA